MRTAKKKSKASKHFGFLISPTKTRLLTLYHFGQCNFVQDHKRNSTRLSSPLAQPRKFLGFYIQPKAFRSQDLLLYANNAKKSTPMPLPSSPRHVIPEPQFLLQQQEQPEARSELGTHKEPLWILLPLLRTLQSNDHL